MKLCLLIAFVSFVSFLFGEPIHVQSHAVEKQFHGDLVISYVTPEVCLSGSSGHVESDLVCV